MEFNLVVTSDTLSKTYSIPTDVEVECGNDAESIGRTGSMSIKLSYDLSPEDAQNSILSTIKADCISLTGFKAECCYNGTAIYTQDKISKVRYRLVKIRRVETIREELIFEG